MKEARSAYNLIEAMERLSDLLWDRYADQLIQIYCEEEQNQPRDPDPFDPFGEDFEDNLKEKP